LTAININTRTISFHIVHSTVMKVVFTVIHFLRQSKCIEVVEISAVSVFCFFLFPFDNTVFCFCIRRDSLILLIRTKQCIVLKLQMLAVNYIIRIRLFFLFSILSIAV
jgi:hypothetical protein